MFGAVTARPMFMFSEVNFNIGSANIWAATEDTSRQMLLAGCYSCKEDMRIGCEFSILALNGDSSRLGLGMMSLGANGTETFVVLGFRVESLLVSCSAVQNISLHLQASPRHLFPVTVIYTSIQTYNRPMTAGMKWQEKQVYDCVYMRPDICWLLRDLEDTMVTTLPD